MAGITGATCLGEGTVFDGSYRGTYWGEGIGNLSKGLWIFRVGTGKSITVAVIDFVRHGILVLLVGFVFLNFSTILLIDCLLKSGILKYGTINN